MLLGVLSINLLQLLEKKQLNTLSYINGQYIPTYCSQGRKIVKLQLHCFKNENNSQNPNRTQFKVYIFNFFQKNTFNSKWLPHC